MERVTADETSLLLRDEPPRAWHLTEVTLLAGVGLTRFEVGDRVAERLPYAPRFRRRPVTTIGGELWVDAPEFAIDKHVRQMRVPPGATLASLQSMVGELTRAPLTRQGPRWEVGVAARLAGKRCALVTRVHPAWVDGGDHVHLLQELLDDAPVADAPVPAAWTPEPAPEEAATLVDAVRDPGGLLASVGATLSRWGRRGAQLVGTQEEQPVVRDAGGTGVPLDAVKRLARARGVRVHDVLVALVAGGLRRVGEHSDLVAMVPQAVEQTTGLGALGFAVEPRTLALPVRTADALERLEQVASLTQAAVDTGRLVPAPRMLDLPGHAPSTLHCLAMRCASAAPHDVLISQVPGPQTPRYLGERPVKASYPMLGLTGSQRWSVGITSYAGQVYFGLCGVGPVAPLGTAIVDELQELLRRTEA